MEQHTTMFQFMWNCSYNGACVRCAQRDAAEDVATVLPLCGENWTGFHRRAFQCGLNSLQMTMYHFYNQEQYNKSSFHSKKSGFNEAQRMQAL